MNIADLIEFQARTRPDAPALIAGKNTMSYAELDAAVRRLAASFAAQGLAPGDMVGCAFGFLPVHVVIILALARLGAVIVPVPRNETPERRKETVERFGVCAIVGSEKSDAVDGCGLVLLPPDWMRREARAPAPTPAAPGGERPWALMLSSGVTGTPRAVIRTHAQAIRLSEGASKLIGVTPRDRYLSCVSATAGASKMRILRHLLFGSAVVFTSSRELFSAIERHGVTHTFLTPAALQPWIRDYRPENGSLATLRHFGVGGGPVGAAVSAEFMQRITPHLFIEYGTVETHLAAIADPEMHRRHANCIGRAVPWVEAQVVDERGVALPPGSPGALRFRGDPIATTYYPPEREEQATAKAFRGGWFYPGDIARIDADGLITVEGRTDDLVNIGGAKVAMAEVERVFAAHPDVVEVAAFRVASTNGWDRVMAAVVVRRAVEEQALLQYGRARLGYGAPERVFQVDALPRGAMGKVVRSELASRLA